MVLNPFDDKPTKYEAYLNEVAEAHGMFMYNLKKQIDLVENTIKEHNRLHEAANRAAFSEPKATDKDEPKN